MYSLPAFLSKVFRGKQLGPDLGSVLIWILLGCFFWHDSVRSLIDGIAKVDRRASIVAAAYPFADHSIVGGTNRRFVLFPESTVIRNGSLHDETNLAGQNTLKYFWGRIWSRDHQSVSTPTWNDGTFTWNGKMPMFSALDRSFDRPIDSSNSSVIDRDQYFSRRNMSNIVQRNFDEIPSHGTLWLSHYEVRPISDLKLADSNVNASLSSYNLSLERGDLLLSDNRRIRAIFPTLLCRSTQKLGLSGHFFELLKSRPSGYSGGDEGEPSDDCASNAESNGYFLETSECVSFGDRYRKWGWFLLLSCVTGCLLRLCGEILFDYARWSIWINRLYERCSGRGLTDRERVFLSIGCMAAAVRIGFQAIINVAQ